jgi:hypothetical protein
MPLDSQLCGRIVRPQEAAALAAGQLDFLEDRSQGVVRVRFAGLGPSFQAFHVRCFAMNVDPSSGDAVATGHVITREYEEVHCGLVRRNVAPTASQAGEIAIGLRTFTLPQGSSYHRDPAGSPSDLAQPGHLACLQARFDDTGQIAEYGPNRELGRPDATGRVGGICGGIAAYAPPTADREGLIVVGLRGSFIRVPAGTGLDTTLGCYDFALDEDGEIVITKGRPPEPVRL